MLGFLDAGLNPGSSYTYRVTATDRDGNTATSGPASITVPSGTAPVYPNRVLADGAGLYWRLGSTEGGSADVVGNDIEVVPNFVDLSVFCPSRAYGDLERVVGGRVVDQHHLEVIDLLGHQAVDALLDVGGGVVERHNDAQQRPTPTSHAPTPSPRLER